MQCVRSVLLFIWCFTFFSIPIWHLTHHSLVTADWNLEKNGLNIRRLPSFENSLTLSIMKNQQKHIDLPLQVSGGKWVNFQLWDFNFMLSDNFFGRMFSSYVKVLSVEIRFKSIVYSRVKVSNFLFFHSRILQYLTLFLDSEITGAIFRSFRTLLQRNRNFVRFWTMQTFFSMAWSIWNIFSTLHLVAQCSIIWS